MAFGLFAVLSMLVCYSLEKRSHWYTLAFAGSCALAQATAFWKGRGRLDSSRRFGPSLRYTGGDNVKLIRLSTVGPVSVSQSRLHCEMLGDRAQRQCGEEAEAADDHDGSGKQKDE